MFGPLAIAAAQLVVASAATASDGQPLMPLQGSLTAGGLYGRMPSYVGGMYLGGAYRLAHDEDGAVFVGAGLQLNLGRVAVEGCEDPMRCGYRYIGGPGLRIGRAWQNEEVVRGFPHTYVYAQVTPFSGAVRVEPAPLSPGHHFAELGVRFDVGINSLGWSRAYLDSFVRSGAVLSSGDGRLELALLIFGLLNHLELSVEVSRDEAGEPQVRAGLAAGAGF